MTAACASKATAEAYIVESQAGSCSGQPMQVQDKGPTGTDASTHCMHLPGVLLKLASRKTLALSA